MATANAGPSLAPRKSKRLAEANSHQKIRDIVTLLRPKRAVTTPPSVPQKKVKRGRSNEKPVVIISHQDENPTLMLDLKDSSRQLADGDAAVMNYEELRDRNIKQRAEMLNKLGLEKVKQPKTPRPPKKPKVSVSSPRKSPRLRNRTYTDFSLVDISKFAFSVGVGVISKTRNNNLVFEKRSFLTGIGKFLQTPIGVGVSFKSGNVNEQLQNLRHTNETRYKHTVYHRLFWLIIQIHVY